MAVLLVIFLLFVPLAFAEKYYVLGLSQRGEGLVLSSLSVEEMEGGVTPLSGSDRIVVLSQENQEIFSLGSDFSAPELSLYYIPYQESGERMELRNSLGEVLLDIPLGAYAKVCGDGLCQGQESWASCPKDCEEPVRPLASDTEEEIDDQERVPLEESTEKPSAQSPVNPKNSGQETQDASEEEEGVGILTLVLILLALGGAGVLFWRQRKGSDDRLSRIHQYIDYNLKKGYPLDQIAHTLLERGISEGEIQEAMGKKALSRERQ